MADWYFRGGNQPNNLHVCPGCRNLVRRGVEFCPFCAKRLRAEGGLRSWLRRAFSRPDAMTRFILGLIVAGFLLQFVADFLLPGQLGGAGGNGKLGGILQSSALTYIRLGSNFYYLVAVHHEFWRLVTYCFLHSGVIHLLFNGWALWDLGRLTERLWGLRQLFAVFILTGIAGGAASTVTGVFVFGQAGNSVGASGAICGVLGLLLGAYFKNKRHLGEYLGSELIRWAVMILVFGLVVGADNAAHVGGMAAGAALGYLLPPTNATRTPVRDAAVWKTLFGAALALFLISLGCAAVFYARGPLHAARLLGL